MKLRQVAKKTLDDATGPHSLEMRGFFYVAPAAIVFSLVSTGERVTDKSLFNLVIANLAALVLVGLLLWSLSRTLYKNRKTKRVPYSSLLFAILSVGITKGVATAYFLWLLNPDSVNLTAEIVSRSLQATVIGAAIMLILASVTASLDRYETTREQLVFEKVRLQLSKESPIGSKASERELKVAAQQIESLALSLKQLSTGKNTLGASQEETNSKLLEFVEKTIRPASHRIWSESLIAKNEFTAPSLLEMALRGAVYDWTRSSPVYLALILPSRIAILGVANAMLFTVISGVVIYGLSKLAVRIAIGSALANLCKFVIFLILESWISLEITSWFIRTGVDVLPLVRHIGSARLLGIVCIAIGMVVAARETNLKFESQLKLLNTDSNSNMKLAMASRALANRTLAQYLHGEVQNRILSMALRIGRANSTITPDFVVTELMEIKEMLVGTPSARSIETFESLEAAIYDSKRSWGGFIDISFEIDFEDFQKLSEGSIYTLSQIINEAVSNAWRHGNASSINFRMNREGEVCALTARDNGIFTATSRPGLGSKLFDSVSQSGWRLEVIMGGGTLLSIDVPITFLP